MHRHAYLSIVIVVALTLGVAGCKAAPEDAAAQATPTVMRISGSSACMPCLRLLTDTCDFGNVEWWYLSSPGSRSGIEGAASGELAIGTISRELSADEQQLGLVYTRLSDDGVVFALHPSVGIANLTTTQVCDIYAGVYTNWKELGGPDLPIVVLDRHDDEPSKAIMREFVFGPDLVPSPRAVALYSETDMVNGIESTQGSIGYISLGYGLSNGVKVDYPALDGVAPSVESIRNGSYRIVRPLGIVTSAHPTPEVTAFLEWAKSETACEMLETNGYVASARAGTP